MFDEFYAQLDAAERPVLFWSGGWESTLLLAIMRQYPKDFDIFQSREGWTKEQRDSVDKTILLDNLKVFSYPPHKTFLIGNDNEITFVYDYALGNATIPILKDFVGGGEKCIAELDGHRMAQAPFEWDLHIVGSRKDDTHYAFESEVMPSKEWSQGDAKFYSPLFDLTRDEVLELAKDYGVEAANDEHLDTGNLVGFCTNCLGSGKEVFCPDKQEMIPTVDWDRKVNLATFRERMRA